MASVTPRGLAELPHATESEARVLGSIFLDPSCIDDVRKSLEPEQFYSPSYREIYAAMLALHTEGVQIDAPTVVDRLRVTNRLNEAGGALAVSDVLGAAASAEGYETHVGIIADRYLQRRLITYASTLGQRALAEDPHVLLREGSEALARLNGASGIAGDLRIGQAAIPARHLYEDTTLTKPESLLGDGLITEGGFTLLFGKPGLGKTWAMLQLALAISSGKSWYGLKTKQCNVGILELEMHSFYLRERLKSLVRIGRPVEDLDGIYIVARPNYKGIINLADKSSVNGIVNWIGQCNLRVLFMDALSRTHYANENDSREMGAVLAAIDRIREETGCAVVPLHHEPKDSKDSKGRGDMDFARGSSRLQSDPQTLIRLKVQFGHFCLSFPKVNLGAIPENIWLNREPEGYFTPQAAPLDQTELKQGKLEKVESALAGQHKGLTLQELMAVTGFTRQQLYKYLSEMGIKSVKRRYYPKELDQQKALDVAMEGPETPQDGPNERWL